MLAPGSKRVYHSLVIRATDPTTEIWLVDEEGFLVQTERGTLNTRLLPGDYAVEFGLDAPMYQVILTGDRSLTQAELESGPSCPRRIPDIPEDDAD
jgi:hypothetical protein